MQPHAVHPPQARDRIGIAPIAVIIPAWNEEGSIGRVIDDLPKDLVSVSLIVVADNNSTDYTADVARKFGATVVPAPQQGYGSCLFPPHPGPATFPADRIP